MYSFIHHKLSRFVLKIQFTLLCELTQHILAGPLLDKVTDIGLVFIINSS